MISFPLKNFLKDEGIIFRFYLFIMERYHQRHVVLRLQVFHFLPGEVVGPEGKFSSSCLEEAAGFPVAVNASGKEHAHIRVVQDELAAGGPGELGVGEEIDISFFNGFVIPAPEDGERKVRDFIMDEILPMSQAEPFIVKLGGHVNAMAFAEGLVEKDTHGKAPPVMGHRHEKGCAVFHEGGGSVHHLFPKVRSPVLPAVGGINDRHVGVKAPHGVAAVKGIVFPVVAREEEAPAFYENIEPHGTGAVACASPFHRKARFQLQFRRRGVQYHGIPGFVVKLSVGLVGHEYRPVKSLLHQVLYGPGVIPVGMGNEEVLRLMNLLRRQVRNPVQTVGGRPGVHNKSVAVTLHVETVSSFVTASTCYEKLHIHISIRTLARSRQFDFPAAFRLP